MTRRSWDDRIESHYNIQVNVEEAKYLRDSVQNGTPKDQEVS